MGLRVLVQLLRTLPALILLGIAGAAFWWWQNAYQHERQLRIKYENYLVSVLGERRAAEVTVLDSGTDKDGTPWRKIRFVEFGSDGKPLQTREVTIKGDEIYFDAMVMVFQPESVEEGKTKSLYLFRRIFSNVIPPEKGVSLFSQEMEALTKLDNPELCRAARRVWREFQRCLQDREYRQRKGVRTIFGQAVYQKLRKGYLYTLLIQNNGGIIMEERPIPEVFKSSSGVSEKNSKSR